MGTGPETCLLVCLPEVDLAAADVRARLDPNAGLGIPAHITVLTPFVPADQVDEGVISRLAAVFAQVEPFEVSLSATRWFDVDVLWLAPADDRPFRRLTAQLSAAFPDCLPFNDASDDVVPHLTIGHRRPLRLLRQAEREVGAMLPIVARATAVTLFVPSGDARTEPGQLRPRQVFPLGRS